MNDTQDAPRGWLSRRFPAFRHRNYRLLWQGTLISNTGDWMDQVALNWLVISISGNPFHLAMVNLCRGIPILIFTLIGGALADRVERRRLMMVTQTAAMVLALALAALVLSGRASIWVILVVATLRGVIVSINLPARHSLVAKLVPKEDLPNAVALNSLTLNMTKVIGPSLAGLIIALFGTGICFLVNGLSFIVVIRGLAAMRFKADPPRPRTESLGASIAAGLAYVRGDRAVFLLVLIALVPTFFGQPYMTLLALFAYDAFQVGPEGLGLLTSVAAAGSVGGALIVTLIPGWGNSGRAMLAFLLLFGVFLTGFAVSPVLWLAAPVLFGVGMMHIAVNVTNNTLMQMAVPDHVKGRVMSVMLMNRGLVQLGAATWAALAGFIGVRASVASAGVVIAVMAVLLILFTRLGRGERRE